MPSRRNTQGKKRAKTKVASRPRRAASDTNRTGKSASRTDTPKTAKKAAKGLAVSDTNRTAIVARKFAKSDSGTDTPKTAKTIDERMAIASVLVAAKSDTDRTA